MGVATGDNKQKLGTVLSTGLKWGITLEDNDLIEEVGRVYLKEIDPKSEVYLLHLMQTLIKKVLSCNDTKAAAQILKELTGLKTTYEKVTGGAGSLLSGADLELDPEELEMTIPKVEKNTAE